MKHKNIPIFIAHEGCPNNCVFCDQKSITGTCLKADRDIKPEIENALSTIDDADNVEIAFFGGSFTGIDIHVMTRLCDTAFEFVKSGKVSSIRLSTRPDYINDKILDILKSRGVQTIELGIQSMKDDVLYASGRGHTAECTRKACKLIKEYGFNLCGQMMIGLPESSINDEIYTANEICALGCTQTRIYPTVVFHNTQLYNMCLDGSYKPLEISDAVQRCAKVYEIFRENNVEILRIGLHSSEELQDESKVYAGAFHPALGEIVIGEYYYNKILNEIENIKADISKYSGKKRLIIYTKKENVSKMCGHKKANKYRLKEILSDFGVFDVCFKTKDNVQNALFDYRIENFNNKSKDTEEK